MERYLILGMLTLLSFVSCNKKAAEVTTNQKMTIDLSMYPAPKSGQKQVYIQLSESAVEADLKVEIYAGKMAETDCNRHFLLGEMTEKNLTGWGYTYYEFVSEGNIGSTRMACPDGTKKREFVKSSPTLMRYNSRLPIVVYVPQDCEVRYRVWQPNDVERQASIGKIGKTDKGITNPQRLHDIWVVERAADEELDKAAKQRQIPVVEIHVKDKKIMSSNTCNKVMGDITNIGEGKISFGNIVASMICPGAAVAGRLSDVLEKVESFHIRGLKLFLLGRNGEELLVLQKID